MACVCSCRPAEVYGLLGFVPMFLQRAVATPARSKYPDGGLSLSTGFARTSERRVFPLASSVSPRPAEDLFAPEKQPPASKAKVPAGADHRHRKPRLAACRHQVVTVKVGGGGRRQASNGFNRRPYALCTRGAVAFALALAMLSSDIRN